MRREPTQGRRAPRRRGSEPGHIPRRNETTGFRCVPIPTETVERFRATGIDDRGNKLRRLQAPDPVRVTPVHAIIRLRRPRFPGRRGRRMAGAIRTEAAERRGVRTARAVPGLAAATLVAVLAGLASWFALLPAVDAARRPAPAAIASDLAEVAPADIPAALGTMANSAGVLAQFRGGERRCGQHLAWVALAPRGGAAGAVRLRSGAYISPEFALAAAPFRVAIPFPGPYAAGRGTLEVLHDGGGTIALTPAWNLPPAPGDAKRVVTWRTSIHCPAAGD